MDGPKIDAEEMMREIDAAKEELESMRAILEAQMRALSDCCEISTNLSQENERLRGQDERSG